MSKPSYEELEEKVKLLEEEKVLLQYRLDEENDRLDEYKKAVQSVADLVNFV